MKSSSLGTISLFGLFGLFLTMVSNLPSLIGFNSEHFFSEFFFGFLFLRTLIFLVSSEFLEQILEDFEEITAV